MSFRHKLGCVIGLAVVAAALWSGTAAAAGVTPQGLKADGLRLQGVAHAYGAVLVGEAAVGTRPDDRSGLRDNGFSSQIAYPDLIERVVASHRTPAGRPDDRSGLRASALASPYPAAVEPVSHSGDGFDWGAAGVGASTTVALLLGLGLTLGTARSRKRSAAA